MLMPKRVKYRKPHSAPRIKGKAKRGTEVAFGEFGLVVDICDLVLLRFHLVVVDVEQI